MHRFITLVSGITRLALEEPGNTTSDAKVEPSLPEDIVRALLLDERINIPEPQVFVTLGAFDLVVIFEAEDEEQAVIVAVAVSQTLGGEATTLTAVSEASGATGSGARGVQVARDLQASGHDEVVRRIQASGHD